jgi:dolichol kinase
MEFRNEIYRKLIHIASSAFPLAYLFLLDRITILWIVGICAALLVAGELLRLRFSLFARLFKQLFSAVVRQKEDHSFTGATFVFSAAFLTILLFEKLVAVFALLVLSLADSMAALVGKRWGRRPLLDKTVEGTVTFLIVAVLLSFVMPGIPRQAAFIAALVATLVELLPSPVNDNLLVPLSAAISISMVNLIA